MLREVGAAGPEGWVHLVNAVFRGSEAEEGAQGCKAWISGWRCDGGGTVGEKGIGERRFQEGSQGVTELELVETC